MIIGIDHGYTYTKNSKGEIFPSIVKMGKEIDIRKVLEVEIDNEQYVLGEKKGNFTVEMNKVNALQTKICMLTSIALSCKDMTDVKVITGLPPGQYATQKEQLKRMILNNNFNKVIINGIRKFFRIVKADIFIQGAGPVFTDSRYENVNVLVIDWGGITVDCCYFENQELVKYRTYRNKGMLKLYSNMIDKINSKHELTLELLDGEKVLKEGLTVDGKKQDLSFIYPTINEHLEGVITNIRLDFPLRTTDYVLLIGGGGEGLNSRIIRYIPNIELLPNSQFTNANIYEDIGRMRFGV